MKEVYLYVRTNKKGSDCCAGSTGYTREEWDKLTTDEQNEIANELIWNVLDVYDEDF